MFLTAAAAGARSTRSAAHVPPAGAARVCQTGAAARVHPAHRRRFPSPRLLQAIPPAPPSRPPEGHRTGTQRPINGRSLHSRFAQASEPATSQMAAREKAEGGPNAEHISTSGHSPQISETPASLSFGHKQHGERAFGASDCARAAVNRAMARRQFALATSAHAPSKNKKRRSGGGRRDTPALSLATSQSEWSDLEPAFFDAAPPDGRRPGELERFDDLVVPEQHERVRAFGQAVADAWAALRRLLFGPAQRSRPASSR